MNEVYAASRGRSHNVCVYRARLPTANGAEFQDGLCTKWESFNAGDFIGFYTGTWGSLRRVGTGPYTLAFGDDEWFVSPPKFSCAHRVNLQQHMMAAINEPFSVNACGMISMHEGLVEGHAG